MYYDAEECVPCKDDKANEMLVDENGQEYEYYDEQDASEDYGAEDYGEEEEEPHYRRHRRSRRHRALQEDEEEDQHRAVMSHDPLHYGHHHPMPERRERWAR